MSSIIYNKVFGKYLFITNTMSYSLLMATGDVLQQRSEFLKKLLSGLKPKNENTTITSEKSVKLVEHDYARTRNMFTVGLVLGPYTHYFYTILEKYVPGKNTSSILKKIVLDQLIAGPTCLGIFFCGLGALERKSFQSIVDEIKFKLLYTYKIECLFWVPSQLVNFILIPMRYRVIYISFMAMIYDMFLSHIKYDVDIP